MTLGVNEKDRQIYMKGLSMKVLNIGTSFGGGAGIAMRRISEAQSSIGLQVQTWALNAPKNCNLRDNEKIINRNISKKVHSSTITKLQSKFVQKSDLLVTSIGIDLLNNQDFYNSIKQFDIVNFHSIYNLTSLTTILEVSRIKPTTITLHDERILTGGCHYSFSCRGYLESCGNCPQVRKYFFKLPVRELEKNNEDFYLKLNLANISFIAPSRWLADKARTKIANHEIVFEVIPNPIPKSTIRSVSSGVQGSTEIKIGFISENLYNPYKGLALLVEALNALAGDFAIQLTLVGRGKLPDFDPRIKIIRKYVKNDQERVALYEELDFIVAPSTQDNLPSVISESLMVGTPVIGSDAGGIPEMLLGFDMPIVRAGSVEALIFAIKEMKKDYDKKAIREKAQSIFSYEVVGKKYFSLFKSLI